MDELDKRDREIYMQRNIADVAATPIGTPGDELSEEEQVTEAALMADASFARNSRIVYQFIHGKPFEGSDVEAGRYGIDAIGEVYWNLTGQRTGGGVHAADHIGDGHAHFHRLAVGLAGDGHQPAAGLDYEVVPRHIGLGASASVAGDRTSDQRRVQFG